MNLNHRPNALMAAARRPRMIVAAAAVAALAAARFALHPPATHAAQAKGAVVSTAKTSLGRIIVNSSGRTLYLFEKDRNGKSACSGQCAVIWPPLITSGKPGVTGGARASLIGTTRRSDGRLQVTYNHHPLYTFVKDKKAGQTNGEGVNAFRSRLGCDLAGRSQDRQEDQQRGRGGAARQERHPAEQRR